MSEGAVRWGIGRRGLPLAPLVLGAAVAALAVPAMAHDPLFGLGAQVLYKDGIAASLQWRVAQAGPRRAQEAGLALTYGITGDWAAGLELPWELAGGGGRGDLRLFTKYRFWRRDALGVQESAALALRVGLDGGATAPVLGLAYGYESRRWYRWASVRWHHSGSDASTGGDRLLLDLVGGWRPRPGGYLEPDAVWLLELNGELVRRAQLGGAAGAEWFLAPGLFWTLRNYAVKAGVQVPVHRDLEGPRPPTRWRALLVFEGHW